MALVSGTTHTYNQAGLREDLYDVISNISPTDTPFQTGIEKRTAKARLHEWLTDTLGAAENNQQLEGDDASYATAVTVTRMSNNTQIMRKTFLVSGTLDAVDKAGRKSEIKYQLMKAGKELIRDLETALTNANTGSAGGIATARQMIGAEAFIPTTDNGGNGVRMSDLGSTTSFGGTHLVTDGTDVAMTSTKLLNAVQNAWTDGGNIDVIMTNTGPRSRIRTFGNLATNQIQLNKGGETAKLIDGVEIYVTDYGKHKLVLNRFVRNKTALVLDMSTWAMATLRPMATETLAKTGDAEKRMVIMESTLVCMNPDANSKVCDASS